MDAREIAAKLTKGQREAVIMASETWLTSFGMIYRAKGSYATGAESAAHTRFCGKLPTLFERNSRLTSSLGGTALRLTSLGLAVRAALLESETP